MAYAFTRESEVRAAFWQGFQPHQRTDYRKGRGDVPMMRGEFACFVDMLARDGQISEDLAFRVTLDGEEVLCRSRRRVPGGRPYKPPAIFLLTRYLVKSNDSGVVNTNDRG